MSAGCKALQVGRATRPRSAEKEGKQGEAAGGPREERGVRQPPAPCAGGDRPGSLQEAFGPLGGPCRDRDRGFALGMVDVHMSSTIY